MESLSPFCLIPIVAIHFYTIDMIIYNPCMCQSQVEIEHYFIAYFDHITTFKAL